MFDALYGSLKDIQTDVGMPQLPCSGREVIKAVQAAVSTHVRPHPHERLP